MAIYLCAKCDRFFDDDYDPCEEVNGDLVCPGCYECEEEDGQPDEFQEWYDFDPDC